MAHFLKRLVAYILAVVSLLLAAPASVQAQSGSGDGFNYSVNASNANTITITLYTGGYNTVVAVPTNINNLLVTGIGNGGNAVFSYKLTGVTIPNSVTSIGGLAFNNCFNLTSITIPDGVTSIGFAAFDGPILTDLTIPNSVTSIGDSAFYGCCMTSITIGNAMTNIGEDAFGDCLYLTNLTIADGLPSIGESVFECCTGLTSITIPNSVTNIGDFTFYYCTSLTNITIGNGISNIGEDAFLDCPVLTNVFFTGNAPGADSTVFEQIDSPAEEDPTTVYYLPGTAGWSAFSTQTGVRSVLWNPQIQTNDTNFGVSSNHFGFNITGTPDIPIVIAATINLTSGTWTPLQSCTLTNGSIQFSDPGSLNYPSKFYTVQFP